MTQYFFTRKTKLIGGKLVKHFICWGSSDTDHEKEVLR